MISVKHSFLLGDRVYLRGLNENDLKGNYVEWFNDAEVCQHNSHHIFPYTRANAEEYFNNIQNSKDTLVLAVILKENDLHIGNVSLQRIDYLSNSAEFAILIGEKDQWGKGYSKEAAMILLLHGFNSLNLNRIYCATTKDNVAMQKLAEYLGMKMEGLRRQAVWKNGKYRDVLEYGVLKNEFLERTGEY